MDLGAKDLEILLFKKQNKKSAKGAERFFKCGKGQYGEGDKFLGVSVPECRKIAKHFFGISLSDIEKLLQNPWHEVRLVSLFLLIEHFRVSNEKEQKKIFDFYLKNTKYINNWDLVDTSVYKIVGEFLLEKDRIVLYSLAQSKSLWERRMSIVATYRFIKNGDFKDALEISKILSKDSEDLIHKACGWMLREVGKKDKKVLSKFLDNNFKILPRTTLRYAIERMDEKERKYFLKRV
ncbi:MAG: hypothetical protein QG585_51 [Patescibacteria group bacterium]|jgi:3-methyladenine DNA glycosylase AlkD|nr:hypothetical protein [Patescibacteria group bacterium]